MHSHYIRVYISESYWTDVLITADTWFDALYLGEGQSPIGRAVYLREA